MEPLTVFKIIFLIYIFILSLLCTNSTLYVHIVYFYYNKYDITINMMGEKLNYVSEIFGSNVKKQRKLLGMTRAVLAEMIDISDSYLGRIERGDVNVTFKTIMLLSESLNVPVHELFLPPNEDNLKNIKNILLKEIKLQGEKDVEKLTLIYNLIRHL